MVDTYRLLEALAQVELDHTVLIERGLPRCMMEGCPRARTIKHQTLRLECCDNCAARLIAGKVIDSIAELKETRRIAANEVLWIDLPFAAQIRRMQDVIDVASADDGPDYLKALQ